jgi:hypothetical protein
MYKVHRPGGTSLLNLLAFGLPDMGSPFTGQTQYEPTTQPEVSPFLRSYLTRVSIVGCRASRARAELGHHNSDRQPASYSRLGLGRRPGKLSWMLVACFKYRRSHATPQPIQREIQLARQQTAGLFADAQPHSEVGALGHRRWQDSIRRVAFQYS